MECKKKKWAQFGIAITSRSGKGGTLTSVCGGSRAGSRLEPYDSNAKPTVCDLHTNALNHVRMRMRVVTQPLLLAQAGHKHTKE